jgi:thiopurine S-methyltransferase
MMLSAARQSSSFPRAMQRLAASQRPTAVGVVFVSGSHGLHPRNHSSTNHVPSVTPPPLASPPSYFSLAAALGAAAGFCALTNRSSQNSHVVAATSPGRSTSLLRPAIAFMETAHETEKRAHISPWAKRWSDGTTAWHRQETNSALLQFWDSHVMQPLKDASSSKPVNVFVPLCGKSVDMKYFASLPNVGTVLGIDAVPMALEEFAKENPDLGISQQTQRFPELESWKGDKITLLCGDFFKFDARWTTALGSPPLFCNACWDRGSLVAIDPSLREDYVRVLQSVMSPGGIILLSTFVRGWGAQKTTADGKPAGPPYDLDEDEVQRLFSGDWVESITCIDSRVAAFGESSWSRKLMLLWRFGNTQEKVFVIKLKQAS